jgi:hypothetical protein
MPDWNFPYLEDFEGKEFKKEQFEARKMRILMRGVKIGR